MFILLHNVQQRFYEKFIIFFKMVACFVITIILVPKLNPWVQEYIESKFIADIGLEFLFT